LRPSSGAGFRCLEVQGHEKNKTIFIPIYPRVQNILEEKLGPIECESGNAEVQWTIKQGEQKRTSSDEFNG
jgi:hypothetical protein